MRASRYPHYQQILPAAWKVFFGDIKYVEGNTSTQRARRQVVSDTDGQKNLEDDMGYGWKREIRTTLMSTVINLILKLV